MRILIILLLAVLFISCAENKTIDGKVIPPYGLFNEEAVKDSTIIYQVSPGSVIFGIVFIETVIAPIYVVGWDLFEAVKKR